MISHTTTRTINADAQAVWAVLGAFMEIDRFAPEITAVEALSSSAKGQGAKRRCTFKNGGYVVEEVVDWSEGRGYRVRLTDTGPMPLVKAFADIRLDAKGPNETEVSWSMDYRMKYGPLGWLMGQTMMKSMMGKVLDANLEGLDKQVLQAG